jgi:hypothetical protein
LLAGVRHFNGAAGLITPEFLLRRLGTDPSRDRSGVYLFRMFGIPTVLIGGELLLLRGEELRRASRLAVIIHASDAVSAVLAGIRGDLPRKAAVTTSLISGGNTLLAVTSTRESKVSSSRGRRRRRGTTSR